MGDVVIFHVSSIYVVLSLTASCLLLMNATYASVRQVDDDKKMKTNSFELLRVKKNNNWQGDDGSTRDDMFTNNLNIASLNPIYIVVNLSLNGNIISK